MSEFYGDTDDADAARATLDAALEAGRHALRHRGRLRRGENEEFLAPFVGAHRDEIDARDEVRHGDRTDDPHHRVVRNDRRVHPPGRRGQPAPARTSTSSTSTTCTGATRTCPIEETVGAMAELVREGKVKHLGLSEVTGRRTARGARRAPDRRRSSRSGRCSAGTSRRARCGAAARAGRRPSCRTRRSAGAS